VFVWRLLAGRTEIAISQQCALRSLIGLKLGGDLGLLSQIGVHVLVSRFDCFLYCKQTKEQKTRQNRQNLGFKRFAFSLPCRVRLI
jgi:hypothetical protein